MGVDYLTVICVLGFGQLFQLIFEKILQSTGRTAYTMVMQIVGAILNIILDPIFIFGYFGLPAMGTKGAAIATVIGQIVAMLLGVYFNLTKNKDVQFGLQDFQLDGSYINAFAPSEEMFALGVPALRILALSFVFGSISVMSSYALQGFSKGVPSLIISAARQVIVLLPLAYVLGNAIGIYGIWWSFFISETVTVVFALLHLAGTEKRELERIAPVL